jgi:hypothetical protein
MKDNNASDVMNRFAGKGVFPHQLAFTLLFPGRNLFLSPKQLIERLELKNDSHVLEVGPGPGYFSTRIAKDDKNKPLSDSTSIRLGIPAYLQEEMMIFKVELNNFFTKKAQDEDSNLQEIVQFEAIATGRTKITSSMIGWGKGEDWDKTYEFFAKGNEWTYQELLKIFQ